MQPIVSKSKSITSLLYFFLIIVFAYLHIFSSIGVEWQEQLLLGLACPLAYSSLFFFLMAWQFSGPLVIMIGEMLAKDVFRFLSVYTVFLVGFSQAFFVLDNRQKGWMGMTNGLLTLFETTMGDFSLEDSQQDGNTNSGLNTALVILFVVIVAVLLLNLLIAMMGSTYSDVNADADLRWQMERARIIADIENDMSVQEREKKDNMYYIVLNEKRFLQVYDVDETVFSHEDEAGAAGGGGGGRGGGTAQQLHRVCAHFCNDDALPIPRQPQTTGAGHEGGGRVAQRVPRCTTLPSHNAHPGGAIQSHGPDAVIG
jgi:hypothetical protein